MKVISFSLYNQREKDNINMIINCLLSPYIYPEWKVWVYVDDTIRQETSELLKTFEHVRIFNMPRHVGSEAMMWRFLPAAFKEVKYMISRDADSWVSQREATIVNEWIESDKNFHIIRDHCYHSQKIMGGMWGVKGGIIPDMEQMVTEYSKDNTYDQGFLEKFIYPKIATSLLVHRGDQYDFSGNPTIYYTGETQMSITDSGENDEPISGLSFRKVHELNKFECCHCKKVHETYIGAILENLSDEIKEVINLYGTKHNIQWNYS